MGQIFDVIEDHLARWIGEQPMFFVATAPLASDGLVNLSPKGPIGTLAVLDPQRIAYLDYFGSGAETVAHLQENGRIVVMLCAFSGPPRILRLHGTGTVVWPDDERFPALFAEAGFAKLTDVEQAQRAIVEIAVSRVATSCGYGVPLMEHVGEREHYDLAMRKRLRTMGPDEMTAFQTQRNSTSLDGLPAVPAVPVRD